METSLREDIGKGGICKGVREFVNVQPGKGGQVDARYIPSYLMTLDAENCAIFGDATRHDACKKNSKLAHFIVK